MNRTLLALLVTILLLPAGCAVIGVAASGIPQTVRAQYNGLQGQSVGVMVWADRGLLIDWGTIQLDLANSIQSKLESSDAEEVKKATYPWKPASIVRYQRDHPDIEAKKITDIAPALQVTRLIYIEVSSFRTRSETALELFRGQAIASLKIIEVDPATNTAKVAYSEDNISASFPPKAPADGLPNVGDYKTYLGTVDAMGNEILYRLVTHDKEHGT